VSLRLPRTVFALLLGISLAMLLTPGDDVPQGGPDDKVVHALIFTVLAVAGGWAQVPWVALGVGLAAYAAVTEILQATLPINRDGNLPDFLADAVGIGVGLLLGFIAMRLGARARLPRSRSQSQR
jgi:hypothetical protein